MRKYQRPIISSIVSRLNEEPERMIIITGPRQTGKTTVLLQALRKIDRLYRYLAVDEPESVTHGVFADGFQDTIPSPDKLTLQVAGKKDAGWLVRKWDEARTEAKDSERGFVVAFDEIQKIPNWAETVKGLWDNDRRNDCPLHVVLLGSASLLIQKKLSENLIGRFETVRLPYWSFNEMSEAFGLDLASYMYFGGFPGAAGFIEKQNRWREYVSGSLVEPNIEYGILRTQRVDKPILLKMLFELAATHSGQVFSYNRMLGKLPNAGNTTTLTHYLNLMSNAGLITGFPKYTGRVHHRRASSPKLNVLNTAVMSVCSGYTFEEAKADRSFWERMVRSTVGAHLFNTGTPEVRLYYWKDKNYNVDFVLELGDNLAAFEVETYTGSQNLSGLKEFERRFSPKYSKLVGKNGIPIEEFLHIPAKDWFRG